MESHQPHSRLNDLKLLFPYEGWLSFLDGLVVNSKTKVKGMLAGKRTSSNLGSSLEFADYRAYIAGDDIRRIDWNLFGRTSKAYIRQYWDEQERSFSLFVDSSQSMLSFGEQEQNKWLFALRAAASIGYLALQGDDRMQISLFNEHEITVQLPNLYGKQAKFMMQKLLADQIRISQSFSNSEKVAVSHMMKPFKDGSKLPRRAGITWIFSDGLYEEGLEQLLANLLARQQQIVFVHILHGQELDPQFEGELDLIDIETNASTEVAMSNEVLQRYKAEVAAFQNEIKHVCEARGVTYYRLNCSEALPDSFIKLLAQGDQLQYK